MASWRSTRCVDELGHVNGDLLPMWGGALLFVAHGLTFAATGTRFVMRRDVG